MNKKFKRLEQIFEAMGRSHVVIGVLKGAHADDDAGGIKMARLAAVHEFGTKIKVTPKMRAYLHSIGIHLKKSTTHITIPERSFLRSSLLENKELYKRQLAALMKQVVRGEITPDEAYGKLGAFAAGKAQQKIESGNLTPLHPETVRRRRKNSEKPLYDDGQLVQSITWDIR